MLRAALQTDEALRELAQSPLMLSIMTLTYQGQSKEVITSAKSPEARRQQLFDAYVQHARSPAASSSCGTETDNTWLAWLARGMLEHNLWIFLFRRSPEPAWLATHAQRAAYTLGSGVIVILLAIGLGILGGVLVDSLVELISGRVRSDISFRFLGTIAGGVIGEIVGALAVNPSIGPKGVTERIVPNEKLVWSWERVKRGSAPFAYLGI